MKQPTGNGRPKDGLTANMNGIGKKRVKRTALLQEFLKHGLPIMAAALRLHDSHLT